MDAIGYYSSIAHSYEALYREEQLQKLRRVIGLIKPEKTWNLLDIGAGSGLLEEELKDFKITAIEPSEMADLLERKKLHNVKLLRKKISQFRSKTKFDVVFCITVLQDLDKKERAKCLKVAFDSCRKGGKLAISVLQQSNIDLSDLGPELVTDVANDRLYLFTKKKG